MPILAQINAPELSNLSPTLTAQIIGAMMFHARKPPSDPASSRLLTGFFAATDKAVREYEAGRATLLQSFSSDQRLLLFIEGVGRMETCINSAKRSLRHLGHLSNRGVALDRTVRRLAQVAEWPLTTVRDTIEHIDADIARGDVVKGEAHMLDVNGAGDALEIGPHRLAFSSLASALRALHQAGINIIEALPFEDLPRSCPHP